jgi:sterol desaturase/sphingolipid hydroxylase (fatty acid hydroxylase superfamily)
MMNAIEEGWSALSTRFSEFHLCTTVTFLYLCVIYTGASLMFYGFDQIPFLQRYKIQRHKRASAAEVIGCVRVLFFNHVLLAGPLIYLSYPILKFRGIHIDGPLPSAAEMLFRVLFYFVIEDLWVYWGHRILHTSWLYRRVHSVHHEFSAPFGMVSSYAHPVEFIFLGTGTFLGPLIIGGDHMVTIWLWALLRQLEAIDVHSGYDFPWHLSKVVPFYCGPVHHDFHHSSYCCNFSTTFTWCDWLWSTDLQFRERRPAAKVARRDD